MLDIIYSIYLYLYTRYSDVEILCIHNINPAR